MSVPEALKMWTTWAAGSLGEGEVKGSIEPGKYADMAVLSDDILNYAQGRTQGCESAENHSRRRSRI